MSTRACVHHEARPAIAICSACREDICAGCHRATITGYALCSTCEQTIRSALQTDWEAAHGVIARVKAFWTTAFAVNTGARNFFGSLAPLGGWLRAISFGITAQMIGLFAQLLWSWMFLPEFGELVTKTATDAGTSETVSAVLLFAVVPIGAPIIFGAHLGLLWAALRLFGADAHWRLVALIAGYSSAAHLWQLVPPIGEFPIGYMLAIVWLVNVELVGVRRFFPDLNVWKAMGAVFLPFFALSLLGL